MSNYCVILSHDMFSGFTVQVPVEEAKDLTFSEQNALVKKLIKEKLNSYFRKEHLFVLCENYVNKLTVHLHAKLAENQVNYACDHCHNHFQPNSQVVSAVSEQGEA
jgi:hypothetical protein